MLLFCKWFLLGRFVSCLSSKSKNVENILAKFLKHAKKQNRGHKHTHDTQGQSYSSIYENVFHMVLRIFLDAITREKKKLLWRRGDWFLFFLKMCEGVCVISSITRRCRLVVLVEWRKVVQTESKMLWILFLFCNFYFLLEWNFFLIQSVVFVNSFSVVFTFFFKNHLFLGYSRGHWMKKQKGKNDKKEVRHSELVEWERDKRATTQLELGIIKMETRCEECNCLGRWTRDFLLPVFMPNNKITSLPYHNSREPIVPNSAQTPSRVIITTTTTLLAIV